MVLKVSEPEGQKAVKEAEEKKRFHDESVQRTQKGFQILSERGETCILTHPCIFLSAFRSCINVNVVKFIDIINIIS